MRDNDIIGFAFALGHISHSFRINKNIEGYALDKFEKAFECTYQLNFDFLVIQPGIQVIINPSNIDSHNYQNVFAFYARSILNL